MYLSGKEYATRTPVWQCVKCGEKAGVARRECPREGVGH